MILAAMLLAVCLIAPNARSLLIATAIAVAISMFWIYPQRLEAVNSYVSVTPNPMRILFMTMVSAAIWVVAFKCLYRVIKGRWWPNAD